MNFAEIISIESSVRTKPVNGSDRRRFKSKLSEVTKMGCDKANKSIGCTVHQCANHCDTTNYCALDKVNIGTHEANPSQSQCVDCESFVLKSGCGCK